MSTAGRPDGSAPAASDVAARLREAGLVRLVAAATGDGVASAGLLTGALEEADVAHQTSVVAAPESAARATDADFTVALGRPAVDADVTLGTGRDAASEAALSVARELGTVDYELALAGIVAGGQYPESDLLAAAAERGIESRSGVGVPTADVADGLAHTGLVHAPFSGSIERAREALDGLDARGESQRVASMVAFAVCGDDASAPVASESVERFLRPLALPGGRFETVEGYADVLDAVARERPGMAVPLALGAVEPETGLRSWREHTVAAHEAVRSASTGRYDGLFVARCDDAPLGTVARLVGGYRSPEPLTLAVGGDEAVATAAGDGHPEDVGSLVAEVAADCGGTGGGTATRGHARGVDPTAFVGVFREAIREEAGR